jgi:ATP adenylyltransferase
MPDGFSGIRSNSSNFSASDIVPSMDRLFTPWRYAYITAKDEHRPIKGVPEKLSAWPGDLHCVFCNMLAAVDYAIENGMDRAEAEESVGLLERGETSFLVLNAFPYSNGHLMAVPYQHEASLAALPIETASELMLLMRRAERVLRKVYQPDGLNMGLNLGESAGAGVAHHLHIHALPRWSGDTNFMTVVAETRVLPEMLSGTWTRLRAALAADVPE